MPRLRDCVLGLLVASALIGGTAPSAAAVVPAIVGGQPTTIDANPWQVAVIVNGPSPTLCGGSLIASTWVLTAAHCLAGVQQDQVEVFAGLTSLSQRSDLTKLPIASIFVKPDFDATRYVNDVSLIQLAAPVTTSPQLRAIAVPVSQDAATWPAPGTSATITGWGTQGETGSHNSDQLLSATVQVLADAAGPCGQYGGSYVGSSQLCVGTPAGGVDTCQGDSGGPLVVDVNGSATLAGVTSVGTGCAQAAYPGLYTRTAAMVPWIAQYVELATAPPAAPTAVTAVPAAGSTAIVAWQPGAGAGGTATYTVTASPGGATCQTAGLTCTVSGLTPGKSYAFVVQGSNAFGVGAASAPSAAVPAVHATAKVGTSVRASRVAGWAHVSKAKVRVTSQSPTRCRVVGAMVTMLKPGMCRLTAKSGSKTGKAYLAVW